MGVLNFLKKHFFEDYSTLETTSKEIEKIQITRFAINCAVALVANATAAAEFETFKEKKKVTDGEYWLWNIQPNPKENKQQFITKVVRNLLTKSEALIIERNHYLYVADGFTKEEKSLNKDKFSDIRVGETDISRTYDSSEVIYLSLKDPKINDLLESAANAYCELLSFSASKLKKSALSKGVISVEAQIGGATREKMDEADNALKANIQKFLNSDDDKVLPLRKGMKYEELSKGHSGENPATEVGELTKQIFSRVGEAFHIPIGILMGNVADVKTLREDFITDAVKNTVTEQLQTEINAKRYNAESFAEGTFLKINTSKIEARSLVNNAQAVYNLFGSGYSRDEIDEMFGNVPHDEPWSRKHYRTLNNTEIENEENQEE